MGKNLPYSPDGIKTKHYPIVPGPGALDPRPDVLYVLASGNATLEDEYGVAVTYPLVAGQILPFSFNKVTAATATLIGWE
jgi:hypothetical protein